MLVLGLFCLAVPWRNCAGQEAADETIVQDLIDEALAIDTDPVIAEETELPDEAASIAPKADLAVALNEAGEQTISFSANQASLKDVLFLLSVESGLNIVIGQNISGEVTAHFKDIPLEKALTLLLQSSGYYFEQADSYIRILRMQTRIFHLNYPTTIRTGENRTQVQIGGTELAMGDAGGSDGEGGESAKNNITISNQEVFDFWENLQKQLNAIIRESLDEKASDSSLNGVVVVNKLTGTIYVNASPIKIDEIEEYLDSIERASHRQVLIEAKLIEINKNEDHELGIAWELFPELFNTYITGTTNAAGALAASSLHPTLSDVGHFSSFTLGILDNNGWSAALKALEQYGSLQSMGNPRIRTLNNQPAVISVGTNDFYLTYDVEEEDSTSTSGEQTTITTHLHPIFIGLSLDITPQITKDDEILLKIFPVVNRKVSERNIPVPTSSGIDLVSNIPIIDTSQTSTIVKLKNYETIMISGFTKKIEQERESSVPILGKIPILGYLFRSTLTNIQHKDLIIFITPRIIDLNAELPLEISGMDILNRLKQTPAEKGSETEPENPNSELPDDSSAASQETDDASMQEEEMQTRESSRRNDRPRRR